VTLHAVVPEQIARCLIAAKVARIVVCFGEQIVEVESLDRFLHSRSCSGRRHLACSIEMVAQHGRRKALSVAVRQERPDDDTMRRLLHADTLDQAGQFAGYDYPYRLLRLRLRNYQVPIDNVVLSMRKVSAGLWSVR